MMFRFFSLPSIKILLVYSDCEQSVEDFHVPESLLIRVQHVLAVGAQSVLHMEGPGGSESSTRVCRFIDLGDF